MKYTSFILNKNSTIFNFYDFMLKIINQKEMQYNIVVRVVYIDFNDCVAHENNYYFNISKIHEYHDFLLQNLLIFKDLIVEDENFRSRIHSITFFYDELPRNLFKLS